MGLVFKYTKNPHDDVHIVRGQLCFEMSVDPQNRTESQKNTHIKRIPNQVFAQIVYNIQASKDIFYMVIDVCLSTRESNISLKNIKQREHTK